MFLFLKKYVFNIFFLDTLKVGDFLKIYYACIYIHMVFTTERLFGVAIGSWPEWNLNPQPLNSIQKI